MFGSRRAIIGGSSLAGSGPLAVVVIAFVAGLKWKSDEKVRLAIIHVHGLALQFCLLVIYRLGACFKNILPFVASGPALAIWTDWRRAGH